MKPVRLLPRFSWLPFFISTSFFAVFYLIHNFNTAFPSLSFDISMTRQDAITQAALQTQSLYIGPQKYHTAVAFVEKDSTVQQYIELNTPDSTLLNTVIKEHWYELYTWNVRHFNEHDPHEATFFFTSNGTPYGFIESLPESLLLPSLESTHAQNLAEKTAYHDWNIDLTTYTLIETNSYQQTNGRMDYEFVYEHTAHKILDAPCRLSIGVSGNRCTKIEYWVKIPNEFKRLYLQMRTKNKNISWIFFAIEKLLYEIICVIFGLFILIKSKKISPFGAILMSGIITLANAFSRINYLPILWMSYDTTRSLSGFLLDFFISLIWQNLALFGLYTLFISVAEGLGKIGFPNHIRLWSVWNCDVAASTPLFKRTLIAFTSIPFILSYVAFFYINTKQHLGWWIPTGLNIDPNVLATYIPWFSSVALSLQAGFMEECLFRAIPLATAAILGEKYQKRRLFIGIALIAQALIFAGAHCNYPMQPAYARLIELIIPALIFGFLYLTFGLFVPILVHVIYDIFWFALPIFKSPIWATWIHQTAIVFCILIPLLIVLYQRIRHKKWNKDIPKTFENSNELPVSWKKLPTNIQKSAIHNKIDNRHTALIVILTLASTVGCYVRYKPADVTIAKYMPRVEAIEKSQQIIATHFGYDTKNFTALTEIFYSYKETNLSKITHEFIWQTYGKETYHLLQNNGYLLSPCWKVRFVQFDGPQIDRAEEFFVMLNHQGNLIEYGHKKAESEPGKNLLKEEARALVYTIIKKEYALDVEQLTEISAESNKQPNRTDWTFIFANKNIPLSKNCQARIKITLAGNVLSALTKYIHIPEAIERKEMDRLLVEENIYLICTFLLGLLLEILFLSSFFSLDYNIVSLKGTIIISLFLILFNLTNQLNMAPSILFDFNTAGNFADQLSSIIAQKIYFSAQQLILFLISIIAVFSFYPAHSTTSFFLICSMGLISGIFVYTGSTFAYTFLASRAPTWVVANTLNNYLPFYAICARKFSLFLLFSIGLWGTTVGISRIQSTKRRSFFVIPLYIFAALLGLQLFDQSSLLLWLEKGCISGFFIGIVYFLYIQYDTAFIISSVAGGLLCYNLFFFLETPASYNYALASLVTIPIIFFICFILRINKKI